MAEGVLLELSVREMTEVALTVAVSSAVPEPLLEALPVPTAEAEEQAEGL